MQWQSEQCLQFPVAVGCLTFREGNDFLDRKHLGEACVEFKSEGPCKLFHQGSLVEIMKITVVKNVNARHGANSALRLSEALHVLGYFSDIPSQVTDFI